MSREPLKWYRAYIGTISDPKFAEAAVLSDASRSQCLAIWQALLESAAERNEGGLIDTNPVRIAAALVEPKAVVEKVITAFAEIGMISEGKIVAWSRRQYQSDTSTDRVRRHREKGGRNKRETFQRADETLQTPDVTLQMANVTAPDTDTETDTEPKPSTVPKPARDPAEAAIDAIMAASGLAFGDHRAITARGECAKWLAAGHDLDRVILPAVRELAAVAKAKGQTIASMRYFANAIAERAAQPKPVKHAPAPLALNRLDQAKFAAAFVRDGTWTLDAPRPGEPGCPIAAEIIEDAQRKHRSAA